MQLPKFYGNPLEFHKWYSLFKYLVDLNPKIPRIMKLNILANSLRGDAANLTHHIIFTPGSYDILKNNLHDAYGDSEAALTELKERMKAWPKVPAYQYKELHEFYAFAVNYVMTLLDLEEGAAFNARNVLHDLYQKLSPELMKDYHRELKQDEQNGGVKDLESQIQFLLDWIADKVKVAKSHYYADTSHPKVPLGMSSGIAMEFGEGRGCPKGNKKMRSRGGNGEKDGEKKSTVNSLATNVTEGAFTSVTKESFSGNTRGRGRGKTAGRGGRGGNRGAARGRGRGAGNSTPRPSTGNPGTSTNQSKPKDSKACGFCGNSTHTPRNCTQNMKPDTVYLKAMELRLCLNCLCEGHWATTCTQPTCGVDNCTGRHHRKMHGHTAPAKKSNGGAKSQ